MGHKVISRNYKMQAHVNRILIGRADVLTMAREKFPVKEKWQTIDTSKMRVCEVRNKINNPNCLRLAYRKVKSKYGDIYTCDNCAMKIARENEMNWNPDDL